LPAEAQPPRDDHATRRLAPPPGELRLLLVLAAVQFTHVVDFMIMMPLGPQFMRLFGIDPRQFGFLVSAYTFAAAASGFLAAFRIDRADRKRALLALYAGFIVATALCGLAPGYATLLAARVVAGAFGGVLGGLVLAIVADLVPYERRAGATAIVASAFSLASVMGIPSALWLAARFSWRAPFLALAATSVAVAVLAIRVLPAMRAHLEPEARSHSRPWGQLQAIFGVANHRRSFTLMIALMFAGFTVIPFIAPYNVANVGVTESDLAIIYFVGGIATLVTSQVIGRLADRYGKRRVFTIVAFLSVVPLFVTTHLPPLPLPQVVAASVLFFVLVPGRFGPAMALVSGSVEPRVRGSFMTFNAAIQQLGAGLAALVAGLIVGRAADGTLTHYGTVGWIAVGFTLLAIWLARRIRILALPGNAAAVPPVAGS
jgi:predicted MFS family arabinose efflux permease